jgi:hypothetical protein
MVVRPKGDSLPLLQRLEGPSPESEALSNISLSKEVIGDQNMRHYFVS